MGPMRGYSLYNFPSFDIMRDTLLASGIEVVSPADLDRDTGFDPFKMPAYWDWDALPCGFSLHEAAKRDLLALMGCNAYVTLSGWEISKGALAEKAVADWLGLRWLNRPLEQYEKDECASSILAD